MPPPKVIPTRWPVRPIPPKPVTPPPGPGPINPPVPPIPPGTPPVDPGPIVITPVPPGGPPAPVDPIPSGIAPDWSDGCVLVRHRAGSYWVDAWLGGRLVRSSGLGFNSMTQDWINQDIHGVLRFAPPAAVEPWPVRPNTAQKSTAGEALMGTEMSISEKLDVLIAVAEQTAKDVAGLKTPASVEADSGDHWAAAYALDEEPAGLDVPLDTFSPEKAALYAVFERSVINGSKIYPEPRCVALAKALALGTDIDAQGQVYLDLLVKWEVDRDVAIFALLTGLVDPYEGGFTARLEKELAALAGTVKPETLSDGTVVSRFVRLDFEGAYRKLLPSGSGGQAGQGGA